MPNNFWLRWSLRIARHLVVVLFALILVVGFGSLIFGGFMDYRCRVVYVQEADCYAVVGRPPEGAKPRIVVYMTNSFAGWSGGSCHMEYSEGDTLEMSTSAGRLRFRRTGNQLSVNGKTIAGSQIYETGSVFNLHPWTSAGLSVRNLGLVSICFDPSKHKQMIAMGHCSTEWDPVKGLLILAILLACRQGLKKAQARISRT